MTIEEYARKIGTKAVQELLSAHAQEREPKTIDGIASVDSPNVTGSCYCDGAVDLGCAVCTPALRVPAPDVQAMFAALDAAKSGDDVEVDDGTHAKSKA